ncbi:heterokaryon incompatibility protein-domain-containing protein [Immersiella caudata]|uniref:Heterokaryon incompatibility protein-domain-containing protein n=1 Tax=Immersiella caudata TaxID=314043 RepID=A0AA39WK37_9PEZI|nr:heterokaryon incompatibility protein-domain-containing protein [Immersiella caudata]
MPRYTPLDPAKQEIRFLTIEDASDDSSVISCKLHRASLSTLPGPEFVALSYVWGDAKITGDIRVDGDSFAATTNLIAALGNLRSALRDLQTKAAAPKPGISAEAAWSDGKGFHTVFGHAAPTLFWIDAICINQQDISERSSQVQMMGQIYKSAHHVVGWLGSDPESGQAARDLQDLSTQWVVPGDNVEAMEAFMDAQPLEQVFKGLDPNARFWRVDGSDPVSYDSSIWAPIQELLSLPYWERLWIRQEIYLAPVLVFLAGKSLMFGDDIFRFMSQMMMCYHLRKTPLDFSTSVWRALLEDLEINLTFFSRLQGRRRSVGGIPSSFDDSRTLASEPRDHVFGVLGIFSVPMTVDYTAPVREVFMSYVAACLEANASLIDNMLGYSGSGIVERGPTQHGLPSWVEDFSQPALTLCHFGHKAAEGLLLPKHAVPFSIDITAGELKIQGIRCSAVEMVHPWKKEYRDLFPYVWEVIKYYSGRTIHGGTHSVEAIARVLRGDSSQFPAGMSTSPICPTSLVTIVYLLVQKFIDFIPGEEISRVLGLEQGTDFLSSFYSAFPFLDKSLAVDVLKSENLTEADVFFDLMEDPECTSLQLSCLKADLQMVASQSRIFHTTDDKLGVGPPGMMQADLLYVSPVSKYVLVFRPR